MFKLKSETFLIDFNCLLFNRIIFFVVLRRKNYKIAAYMTTYFAGDQREAVLEAEVAELEMMI
jgi:hypothetical protein